VVEGGLDLPGLTIGLSEGLDIGLEKPFPFFSLRPEPPHIFPRIEPVAVANLGNRPLTSVAHEIFHQLGYYHAGLGCNSGVFSISWPPDERGVAEGAFLDTREGSGGPVGTFRPMVPGVNGVPSPLHDLMSYCADNDRDAWVSVRNWNAFGSTFPNGVIPDPFYLGDADLVITQNRAPTVRVTGTIDDQDRASELTVRPGSGSGTVEGRASPYRFVARMREGARREYVGVLTFGADGGGRTVSAEIPSTGVEEITLVEGGNALSSRRASDVVPHVRAVEVDQDRAGTAAIDWQASDSDQDDLEASVEFSADGGRTYRMIANGVVGDTELRLPARLLPRSRRARIRVTTSDGFNAASAASATFRSKGAPPTVRIMSPAPGARVRADDPLTLNGEAWDDRLEQLTGQRLTWLDGKRVIGRGARTEFLGHPGVHVLTLEAQDHHGRRSSTSVRVTVAPVRPVLTFVAPRRQPTSRDRRLTLRVRSSINATLKIRGRRFAVGRTLSSVSVPIRRSCRPVRLRLVVSAHGRSSTGSVEAERRCLR
jgi:hypothetical protein